MGESPELSPAAEALAGAVAGGQSHMVRALLSAGFDVNTRLERGYTALHVAAWNEKPEIVSLLLEFHADTNAIADNGATPLACAKTREVAQLLIDHGARTDFVDSKGRTLLHLAAWYGSAELVSLLVERGLDVNAVAGESELAPLHFAATREVAERLLASGADASRRDKHGRTAVALAAYYGRQDVVELLLAHLGGDAGKKDAES